jgi:hypothetical protein
VEVLFGEGPGLVSVVWGRAAAFSPPAERSAEGKTHIPIGRHALWMASHVSAKRLEIPSSRMAVAAAHSLPALRRKPRCVVVRKAACLQVSIPEPFSVLFLTGLFQKTLSKLKSGNRPEAARCLRGCREALIHLREIFHPRVGTGRIRKHGH